MQYLEISEWSKEYIEEVINDSDKELTNVFVDDFVNLTIKERLIDLEEEELQNILEVIGKNASFFSRLRIGVENLLGEVMLERAMHEADLESEGLLKDGAETLLRRVDGKFEIPSEFQEEE